MIYIQKDEDRLYFDIFEMIRPFYGEKELLLCESQPPASDGGIFIEGRLLTGGSKTEISLKIVDNGRVNISDMAPFGDYAKGEAAFRKALRKGMKLFLYDEFSKRTGKKLPWGAMTGIRPAKMVQQLLEEGRDKAEIFHILTQTYRVSPEKACLAMEVAEAEKPILDKAGDKIISLYIGIPFCPTRCLYCSFTSNSITRYAAMTGRYLEALKREMAETAAMARSKGFQIQSIYIGGGTPTALEASQLSKLLEAVEETFHLEHMEEYTLEAGRPDSITSDKLKAVKSSKVTRISINPQTMNDRTLEAIGRKHTSEDVVRAFGLAREFGFDNINMDLIVGLPGESVEDFENTLKEIARLGPENLTVHSMAVKRASKLNEKLDEYTLVSEAEAAAMASLAQKYAKDMELHPYYLYRQKNIAGNLENVGYSRKGYESLYNVQIMEERQTILAMGAGAITKVIYPGDRIERAFNVKSVEDYIGRLDEMVERKRKLLEQL